MLIRILEVKGYIGLGLVFICAAGSAQIDQNRSSANESMDRDRRSSHTELLDSAEFYKRTDIERSLDFITQSIADLDTTGSGQELARSLTTLGDIYLYHKQFDLAIANLQDAMELRKSIRTALLLGEALVLNGQPQEALEVLVPLIDLKRMVPYQRIGLLELMGDAYRGLQEREKALAYYEEGLKVANKNQVSPKLTDLNSKIADVYAEGEYAIEAEGYYGNSLKLAQREAPQRAIQETEKVADFYNRRNRYDEEIQLRKKSLDDLKDLPSESALVATSVDIDSITSQGINYKIANAYIAQEKLEEAIPYLQRSIVEADGGDDLVVRKDATKTLSEVYRRKGDYTKALETYRDYVAVVDTLYLKKEREIEQAARLNREIAAKQSRISGLERERELSQSKYDLALTEQELAEESNKRQQWIIYSLLFGMLLAAMTAFFFYRSTRQQRLANNLLALKSLRSQMNPHFIFNALNSVNHYIARNDERSANRFLSDFSALMRSVLENSEEDFIALQKELELIKLYLMLEHSRFSDKFDYKVEVDPRVDVDAYQIPPMLLQPYVENAIWHGLRYKEDKGLLKITVGENDASSLEIVITDDGIGRRRSHTLKTKNQRKQRSQGMGNIQRRIDILNNMYKERINVRVGDLNSDGTGTKVVLTLKKD